MLRIITKNPFSGNRINQILTIISRRSNCIKVDHQTESIIIKTIEYTYI